ncbi:MAG: acyltransferase family protein [Crocinitomicaceae bacterium]
MEKKKDHILVINSLRGIAAFSVVLYHFIVTTQDFIHTPWIRNTFDYGQRGVQLFFIISGIVIPLSMIKSNYTLKQWMTFLLKRFIRIEPPYLVAIALGVIYLIGRNYIPGTVAVDLTPSAKDVALHLGYLVPFFEDVRWINDVFWTLAVEFQYYLVLSVIIPLVLSNKIGLRILFYAIFIGAGFSGYNYEFFPHWAPYFLIGIGYILFRKNKIKLIEFTILELVLLVVNYYLLDLVDVGIAIVAIGIIHFGSDLKTRVTLFLGKVSYSLYLIHSIIGAAFINYLSHHVDTFWQKSVVILIGLAISIFSAWLLYRFVEKPTHQYAKKIGQKA